MVIRRRRLAREVVGLSRRPSTLRAARRRGAIDVGTTHLRQAVAEAGLVVLATPVGTIAPLAKQAARFMAQSSILTDVGSSKAAIVRALERTLPRHIPFIGAHPLAGSEQRGIEAARVDLFDGALCVLTATERTNRKALAAVCDLWRRLVLRIIVMEPERHDRLLAAVSHLPHALAFCLVEATDDGAMAVAPRSFLDATRVAKSDPDLWDDILLSNRQELLTAMERFDRTWRGLRTQLARGNRQALRRLLARAKSKRDALHDP